MVTRAYLEERYAKMPTAELLDLLAHKQEYSEMAIEVAVEEIKRWGIMERDAQEYRALQTMQQDE